MKAGTEPLSFEKAGPRSHIYFDPAKVKVVGNTSLAGAYLSLTDRTIPRQLSRIAENLEIVELNLEPDFEDCYIDQMELPEL